MTKIIVIETKGDVSAVNIAGVSRSLQINNEVYQGETLVTGADSELILEYNGVITTLRNGEQVAVSEQWLEDVGLIEAAIVPATADNILAVLDAEGDLLAQLEATAAGGGATTANSGSSFVRLTRIAEATDPSIFSPQSFAPLSDDNTTNGVVSNEEQDGVSATVSVNPITADDVVNAAEAAGTITVTG
ncbi:MAG: retention module-containing protein, partial [Gammaproteobacteria bacterium]|nr:retention module-containing protein [Gammaproteobacteria bacterium]